MILAEQESVGVGYRQAVTYNKQEGKKKGEEKEGTCGRERQGESLHGRRKMRRKKKPERWYGGSRKDDFAGSVKREAAAIIMHTQAPAHPHTHIRYQGR
jgi:hypothetical protein